MKIKGYIIAACCAALLTGAALGSRVVHAQESGDGKKVYALYHGFRRTREHDGDLGSWKQFYNTEKSATGQKTVNYNPDLLNSDGTAQTASVNGEPIVGMQSELDVDYIEYEILLAKAAHIDGFLVDFGFPEYGNTVLLRALMEQAEKYDFEIGVNWCDSWLVDKTWIQSYRPEINTREKRTEYFKTSVQFLMDEVYSKGNAATVQGHPLIFLFGGGLTASEMSNIMDAEYNIPENLGEPWYVRRVVPSGRYQNGQVVYGEPESAAKQWLAIGVDVHSWIAPRLRPRDSLHPSFDKYATSDDVLAYDEKFSSLWKNGKKAHINTAVVTPGFDNHGCAGWGEGLFSGIDRDGGELYRRQWQFVLQNRDLTDVIFIASWSDFTEGHEIEPTVLHGFRELETTEEYAAQIKDLQFSKKASDYLRLPKRLFEARKKLTRFEELGAGLDFCRDALDAAAKDISDGYYDAAENSLAKAEGVLSDLEGMVRTETVVVDAENGNMTVQGLADGAGDYSLSSGVGVKIDEVTAKYLRENVCDAVLEFTYEDSGYESIDITADSKREKPPPIGNTRGDYSVAAQITKNSTGRYLKARVPLYRENIALTHGGKNGSDFWFGGSGKIRDVKIIFEVMSLSSERMKKAFWVVSANEDNSAVSIELAPVLNRPPEFTVCACLMQRDTAVTAKFYSGEELSEGAVLRLEKRYEGESAVLKLYTWDSAEGMRPLDSVFEFSSRVT